MMVEQHRTLVEKLVSGELRYFALAPASIARPPKAIDPAGAVMDREHHAVAEPVIGHGDAFAVDQQSRLDHLLGADALGRQRVAQAQSVRAGQ